jgi:hypothetical protein
VGWLWKEICRRFGLPAEKPFIIKAADMASQWPEFKQLLPPNRIPTLDRNTQMLEEHFPHIIDEARKLKIRALSPAKAKRKFLHSFYQLVHRFERCGASAYQRETLQQQLIAAGMQ